MTFPHRSHFFAAALSVLIRALVACVGIACADAAEPPHSHEQTTVVVPDVDEIIAKAKAYLFSQQHSGNWELVAAQQPGDKPNDSKGSQWTGLTALTTYALLSSGEQQNDPRIAAAIEFLANTKTVGTYALGLRCMVWGAVELNPAFRKVALRDKDLLLANIRSVGDAKGLFWYGPPTNTDAGNYDISVSQFGPLGLAALRRVGIEVPLPFWKYSEDAFKRMQHPDGSWNYTKAVDSFVHINMTAAGVASLLISQEFSSNSDSEEQINKGIAFIGANFETQFAARFPSYGLFGFSRIGAATGFRYFGNIDWYAHGLEYLARQQKADGSWIFSNEFPSPADTSLSTLFLAYGSAPVVINKLRYSITDSRGKRILGHWNSSPRDALNFVQWMGSQVEKRLNWQVVDLNGLGANGQYDAPILWISGDQELTFSPDENVALKQFINQGGLILGNAVSNSAIFSKSFQKLGASLFSDYEFRELSNEHPIYKSDTLRRKQNSGQPALLGMSNGVRELMLLSQQDLSKAFTHPFAREQLPLFQLAEDVVLYATGSQGLQRKGKGYFVAVNPAVAAKRSAKVVRLQYTGNWDPEPGGWDRLSAIIHNDCAVKLDIKTAKLGDGQLAAMAGSPSTAAHIIVYLTGTDQFSFSEPQRKELKAFIDAGGTLMVDAAGGSSLFASSAETEMVHLFGNDARQGLTTPMEYDNSLYTIPNYLIPSTTYREFARTRLGYAIKSPQIFCIRQGARVVAYWSPEDISAGLVGEHTDGIDGYSPESATAIMRNIILSTLPKDSPPSATVPEVLGGWSPSQVAMDYKTLEWQLNSQQMATMSGVRFRYSSGANRLNIKWVALIIDGKEVARDEHFGYAGIPDHENIFQIKSVETTHASGGCAIRALVCGDGGTDSTGQVILIQ